MTAFSVKSCDSSVSIFAVADEMEKKGNTSLSFSTTPQFSKLTQAAYVWHSKCSVSNNYVIVYRDCSFTIACVTVH